MTSENPRPRPWRKWQDWGVVLLGTALLLADPVVHSAVRAELAVLVLGSLLVLSGLYSLGAPELRTEYAHVALGLLVFASPWALHLADLGSAWWCWIAGLIAVLLGISSLPPADSADPPRAVAELTGLTEIAEGGGRHHRPDPDAQLGSARTSSTRRALSDDD